jgi:hypothetical protein
LGLNSSCLLLDHCLLYPSENRSRFCQRQPEGSPVVGCRDSVVPRVNERLLGAPRVYPHLTNRDLDFDLHRRLPLLPEPFFIALRILPEPAIELSSIKAQDVELVNFDRSIWLDHSRSRSLVAARSQPPVFPGLQCRLAVPPASPATYGHLSETNQILEEQGDLR